MIKKQFKFLIVILLFSYFYSRFRPYEEREYINADQLSKNLNYPIEYHELYSQSGHQLSLLRIQKKNQGYIIDPLDNQNKNNGKTKLKPVLVLPGLFCNMNAYFAAQEQDIIPFVLANEGFDVYVANFRGTTLTQNHKKYSVEDREYWDYDLNDHALDDLPQMIKFLGEFTKQKVDLVTISLGGSITYLSLAQHNEHMEKYINKAVLFSPSSQAWKVNIVKAIKYLYNPTILQYFGKYIFHYNPILYHLAHIFPDFTDWFAKTVAEGPGLYNNLGARIHFSNWPSTTSMKLISHLVQLLESENNQQYDYGKGKNLEIYGQETPKTIDIENIRAGDLHIFYGIHDRLVPIEDHNQFKERAVNTNVTIHLFEKHAHCSFVSPNNERSHLEKMVQVLLEDPQHQLSSIEY